MELLSELERELGAYPWLYELIVTAALLVLAAIVYGITRVLLCRLLSPWIATTRLPEAESRARRAFAVRLARVAPGIVIAAGGKIPGLDAILGPVLHNVGCACVSLCAGMALFKLLDVADLAYMRRPDAAGKPIKGYLQLGKITVAAVTVILVAAILINRNPLILLSGLGAMAAVLMLIFQDTILSVVAGVQLGSNNMVRIGDWIEMPSQHADGFVIEIALHTVKVQNWDKTITTLPVRKLITDSFINWRGMFESGGRRIKRSLFIDQRSVRFLEDAEVRRLDEFVVLNQYLGRKKQELADWNTQLAARGARPINERRVTNLGTFRAYVEQYLRHHQEINQDLILLVRQLQPGAVGIPLEIYCFTSDVRWIQHENVQSDIFDHLLAILPVFDLRVFQQCSDLSGMAAAAPALMPQSVADAEDQ